MLAFQLFVQSERRFQYLGAQPQVFVRLQLGLGRTDEIDQPCGKLAGGVRRAVGREGRAQLFGGTVAEALLVDERQAGRDRPLAVVPLRDLGREPAEPAELFLQPFACEQLPRLGVGLIQQPEHASRPPQHRLQVHEPRLLTNGRRDEMGQFGLLNGRACLPHQCVEFEETGALADQRFERIGRLMLEVALHDRVDVALEEAGTSCVGAHPVARTHWRQDFVYKDPMRNVIFLDNHDMARFYSVVNEDVEKYKTAINWLLTCRGVPQFYYGGEIGMTGTTSPNDGYVRQDFLGGWKEDKVNKFTAAGRNVKENEIWNHISVLANYRKTSSAITTGKLMQFVPQDGVYVYFRYNNKQTVMVVMNTAKDNKTVALKRFGERTGGFSKMKNIATGSVTDIKDFSLDSYKSSVYELLK